MEIFSEVDTDGGGSIGMEEFETWSVLLDTGTFVLKLCPLLVQTYPLMSSSCGLTVLPTGGPRQARVIERSSTGPWYSP